MKNLKKGFLVVATNTIPPYYTFNRNIPTPERTIPNLCIVFLAQRLALTRELGACFVLRKVVSGRCSQQSLKHDTHAWRVRGSDLPTWREEGRLESLEVKLQLN